MPSSLSGRQAMVGYGINVARAGAAGVAGGAGVAGIFGKLGSVTQQAEQPPSGVARGRQPEFGEDDLKPTVIKLNTGTKSGATTTSGGKGRCRAARDHLGRSRLKRPLGRPPSRRRERSSTGEFRNSRRRRGIRLWFRRSRSVSARFQCRLGGSLPGSSTTRTCRERTFGRDRENRNPAGSCSRCTGWVIFEPRLGIQRFQCPDSSKKLHRHFRRAGLRVR